MQETNQIVEKAETAPAEVREAAAEARLIAAAPELLEALNGLVHVIMSGNANWTIKADVIQGWTQQGFAAIAKAEGRPA